VQHRLFKLSCKIKLTVSGTLFSPTDHITQSYAPTLPRSTSHPSQTLSHHDVPPIVPTSQTPNLHTPIHLYHLRKKSTNKFTPILSYFPPKPHLSSPRHLSLHLFSISQHTFPTNLSMTQSFDIFIHFFVHAYLRKRGRKGEAGMGWEGRDDGKGMMGRG